MKRKINNILLMTPRYTVHKNDVKRCVTPLGLAYLASFLERENYQVEILDIANEGYNNLSSQGEQVTYGLDDKEIIRRIERFNPDVAGVSCIFSTQYKNAKHLLQLIKEINPNIIRMTGGSHPTFALDDIIEDVYTILGEGELPTLKLLNILNNHEDVSKIGGIAYKSKNKSFVNQNLQYIEDLNTLSFPATHLLNMENYFKINTPQNPYSKGKRVAQIMTSRGCSAKCVFCTTTNFWGNRFRARSAENVISEIKHLKENYNIDEIQFTDDNFTINRKRAVQILDGIKDFGLYWCAPQGVAAWTLDDELLKKSVESGCYQLTFGIESGNQEVLRKIVRKPLKLDKVKPLVKKSHDLGIKVHAFCVCGLPGETIPQMHDTYNFVKNSDFDSASFFVANPLVGSDLLKICQEKGYLRKGEYGTTSFKLGTISTPDWTAKEVENLVAYFNKEYNKNDTRAKHWDKDKY